ncbi:MAG: response regulator [Scytonema sp. PMC 1069.18]|nr:response regulator [Scytonema sp. PMC 1069.18]MEC4881099.1 response regulator [Scytonema sp. PMC 1070.18]
MRKILIIDDEDGVRKIAQMSLEILTDWEVLTAASGTEGLILAQSQQPDAILLDMVMPDLDGVTTFEKLQANFTTRNIPTIFLSAKMAESEKQKFLDLGLTGLITKPFDAQSLVKQIREILAWKSG